MLANWASGAGFVTEITFGAISALYHFALNSGH